MSITPKGKRRFKVTIEDRRDGIKTVFEVHGPGIQMDCTYDAKSKYQAAACVRLVMDYPVITTVAKKLKKAKKVKKGKKNGK